MRKRRVYLGVLLLAVAGVVGWIVAGSLREREPVYGGKRLSEWVERYGNPIGIASDDMTEWDFTDIAIRHIGTNAVPFLRQWFRYEPGPKKVEFYALANDLLQTMNHRWTLRDHREIRADNVLVAMRALGWKMVTAEIVELSGAIKDPKAYRSALRAADLLVSFGEFSSLAPGLTNRHEQVRWRAVNGIASMGTNAAFAVPALLGLLHDPGADVREAATNALLAIDAKQLEKGTR